jgi:hypothetical protein
VDRDDYHSSVRATALAALCVVLLGCSGVVSPAVVVPSSQASTGRTEPVITPLTVTPATPPGDSLPAFACTNWTGGSKGSANVTAIRMSQHTGYDRFVVQFDSIVPAYTVKREPKAVFTLSPSGQSITLSGSAGALIQVSPATGATTYPGPTDLAQPSAPVLKEAQLAEDFEGHLAWALGLASPACMRVFTLTEPARLVVDFVTLTQ